MAKARPITGLDPCASAGRNARLIAAQRLDEMYSWAVVLDQPQDQRGLHNLRIAAKRLRYTLEIFEHVLPAACVACIGQLEQIQDELGALHDSDVLLALLQAVLERRGESGVAAGLDAPPIQSEKTAVLVDPAQLASLGEPPAEVLSGLQKLLQRQRQVREEQWLSFRRHWETLEAEGFRPRLLALLNV